MNIIKLNTQKAYTVCICLLFFLLFIACGKKKTTSDTIISNEQKIEQFYKNYLFKAFSLLDSITKVESLASKKNIYKQSRTYFKYSEPILAFIDANNYNSLNSPNLLRIHEEDITDVRIFNPIGYQVIEELLHEEEVDNEKLYETIVKTSSRLKLIHQNTKIDFSTHHVIWLLKNGVVRLATTGLSNFDSPVLGQSLSESAIAYKTLLKIIMLYKDNFTNEDLYKKIGKSIEKSIATLENSDFDTFDRYSFMKNYTNNQLSLLVDIQNDWKVEFPFEQAFKNDMKKLFSDKTFNLQYFSDPQSDTSNLKQKEVLGKQLFNDKLLSINNDMSCATCHNKDLAFTDGKKTFNKHQKRNTPTLTYSALQQDFFYDKRSGSLEGQIVSVVNNRHEFGTDLAKLTEKIKQDKKYVKAFDTLYSEKVTDVTIRHTIASYVRSLGSFNSKFDNNINGKEETLTKEEIKGFNLFMGKAACATCHFPPVFNGTVPPNYDETELEVLGVPKTKKWENATVDTDLGRFDIFHTPERKHAFKTPTVRNIAKTAPYMHNGVYSTLEEVMRFYNVGGGKGIGILLENQTLPFDSLNLTDGEQSAIIAFMKTLTDKTSDDY